MLLIAACSKIDPLVLIFPLSHFALLIVDCSKVNQLVLLFLWSLFALLIVDLLFEEAGQP